MNETVCEHNVIDHQPGGMMWCRTCGSLKHLNDQTWNLPDYKSHAVELTHLLAKWILYMDLAGTPPASGDLRDHPLLALLADSRAALRRGPAPEESDDLAIKFPRAWAPYLQAVILGAVGDMDSEGDCRWHLNELARFLGRAVERTTTEPM